MAHDSTRNANDSEQRLLLDSVLEYAPGFVIAIDAAGKLQFINRLLPQHDMKDVIGSDWLQYMPPDQHDALRTWFAEVLATGEPRSYETQVSGPNGEKIWFRSQMGPLRREDRIVGVVLVAQEITELRRVQLEYAAAQRMAAVGTLAAGIAHEINTPIQFVGDSLSFLEEGMRDVLSLVSRYKEVCRLAAAGDPSTAMKEALVRVAKAEVAADLAYVEEELPVAFERCVDGLDRVATIVRSIREFAHPARHEMLPVDLNRAIQNTLTIARNEFAQIAELQTELMPLPPVTCRIDQINQVVLNLVVNAAHAMAKAALHGEKGRLKVRTEVDGSDVVISVSDTGTGIPESIREHIFEPFFTTKDVGQGTGQGLALAWAIVTENHRGSLRYETAADGTTFFVRFPLAGAPSARAA